MAPARGPLALAVLLALAPGPELGAARTIRARCADGDPSCDADRSCNRVCTFALCQPLCLATCLRPGVAGSDGAPPCLVPPCPPVYYPCDPRRSDAVHVPVPLGKGKKGRRVMRTGRVRVVLRCNRPSREACAPELTAGCRADLAPGDCEAHGGDYDRRGLAPALSCHCRTEDGGTPCSRAGDCQGMCIVAPGGSGAARCSEHVVEFGCFTILDRDGNARTLCVD